MSQNPFMQLYVGDYLADTLDLTTEQHGAYLLLLMTMWRHDAKLPNDHSKLARIARVSARRWHMVWVEIQHFFYVDGDCIRNSRLDREHQKATSISEKRSASGAAGGRAKALKDKDGAVANATDLPQHSQKSEPDISNSEAKASGFADPAKALWDAGVDVLTAYGIPSKQARTVIGKWRKDQHPDAEILSAILDFGKAGAVDPIPWITARLRPKEPPARLYDLSKYQVQ
ncbi:hypothetical protein CG51_05955 [Haematobacter missouriensis]|uniref:DUF1376 domain-containing protein n=1 Tax=Haematobacter missouriensis TaxID=366616 RepID=A0A212AQL7_9RHOB|nr:DUF1376 domain-containing protein [Haematobacter missouriensis]KFI30973.1 hypothetical protein CG51_05955 [Haematobacter missouriensis]OWJ73901.1 hypothetical protein CDV53_14320 [Haematobacter missouriensis]OWJ83802.1 hypothetical protein CDV52_09845 [Haematobacter missouriensis]